MSFGHCDLRSCWVGDGAPVRPLSRWFPRPRPPNRTCDFHRIRLSTGHAGQTGAMIVVRSHGEGMTAPR